MLRTWEMPPQRPPSEAGSLLIRATRNCPWARCEFCANYGGEPFRIRPVAEVIRDIAAAREAADALMEWAERIGCADRIAMVARSNGVAWLDEGEVRQVFLGDSDTPIMKTAQLIEIIEALYGIFPGLKRVTSYCRAKTLLHKRPEELKALRDAGLVRLHVGLESGDDEVLASVNKGATAAEMIRAGEKAIAAGFELSMFVMPGLGGQQRWQEHALNTARVLSVVNPHFIRLRTLDLTMVSSAPLHERWRRGEFHMQPLDALVTEVKTLIAALKVTAELVVTDFSMNYYLLAADGRLPEDRERILATLAEAEVMAARKEREQREARRRRANA